MMAGLIVYFLLFNPGMIFGQEQQEDEMSQDGFEDEFIVDEPEITEPQWPSDHDPTWSNTLDSALQDPYFVDLLAEQEAIEASTREHTETPHFRSGDGD